MENVTEQYEKGCKLLQRSELRFNQQFDKQIQLGKLDDDTIDPSHSASQETKASLNYDATSVLKRIEPERKKAELRNLEELSRIRKMKADAEVHKMKADAEET